MNVDSRIMKNESE